MAAVAAAAPRADEATVHPSDGAYWRQLAAPGVYRLYHSDVPKISAIPPELANCVLSENDWMEMKAIVRKEHTSAGKFTMCCCAWTCLLFPTLFTPLILSGIGGRKVFYQDKYPPYPSGCQITADCNYDCWSRNSNSPAISNSFGDGVCFELCNTKACCYDGCDCTNNEPGCVNPPPASPPPPSPPPSPPPPPRTTPASPPWWKVSPPPSPPWAPQQGSRARYVSGTQPFATIQTVGFIAPVLLIVSSLMMCNILLNRMRVGAIRRCARRINDMWSAKPLNVVGGYHYYTTGTGKRRNVNTACYLDFAPNNPVVVPVVPVVTAVPMGKAFDPSSPEHPIV